jgi:hypothetical protein
MQRATTASLGAVLLLALAGAWWLLGHERAADSARVLAGRDPADGAPGFAAEPTPASGAAATAEATPLAPAAPEAGAPTDSQRLVAGRARRAADGSPLAGILVALPGPGGQVARSGSDGAFRFEHAPHVDHLLACMPRDRVPVVVPLPDAAVDVPALDAVLDTGWIQPGLVRDDGGGPLLGAEVSMAIDWPGVPDFEIQEKLLENDGANRLAAGVRTAADGSFRILDIASTWGEPAVNGLEHLAPEARPLGEPNQGACDLLERLVELSLPPERSPLRLQVRASAPGWAAQTRSTPVPAQPCVAAPIVFELQRGGAVAGRVADPAGMARPGVEVGLVYVVTAESAGFALPGLSAVTNEDGLYRIEGVPPGTYLLSARHTKGSGHRERRMVQDVAVRARETTTVDVMLGLDAVLRGVVRDVAGRPVQGARVELRDRLVWPGGSEPTAGFFSGGAVRVFDEGGARLTELTQEADAVGSEEDGSFAFDQLAAGPRRLLVTAPEDATLGWAIADVVIDERRPPDPVLITLPRALRLAGRVENMAGTPLAQVLVSLAGSSWPYTQPEVMTRDDGLFALAIEAPGHYELEVLLDGYVGQRLPVSLATDREDLRIVLEPVPAVRIVVLDAATMLPVTRYEARFIGDGGMTISDVETEDGSSEIQLGGRDPLTVQVVAAGYATANVPGVVPGSSAASPLRVLLARE